MFKHRLRDNIAKHLAVIYETQPRHPLIDHF